MFTVKQHGIYSVLAWRDSVRPLQPGPNQYRSHAIKSHAITIPAFFFYIFSLKRIIIWSISSSNYIVFWSKVFRRNWFETLWAICQKSPFRNWLVFYAPEGLPVVEFTPGRVFVCRCIYCSSVYEFITVWVQCGYLRGRILRSMHSPYGVVL